jgi:hypothetical protein
VGGEKNKRTAIRSDVLQLRRAELCRFRLDLVHLLEMQFAEADAAARVLSFPALPGSAALEPE